MWTEGTEDDGGQIWAIILAIIIIVIIFLLICWGITSWICPKDEFYYPGSKWHGYGLYRVSDVNTPDEQEFKLNPDRIDGKLNIISSRGGILVTRLKWHTLDNNGNVTSSGESKMQGALGRDDRVYLSDTNQVATATLEVLSNDNLLLVYNELTSSRFNGKATFRMEFKRDDALKW